MTVVTTVFPKPGLTAREAYAAAAARLAEAVERLEGELPHGAGAKPTSAPALPVSNTPAAAYIGMVRKAKEYIAAGDIFQAVLSQRFSIPFTLPPFALYRALRRLNPSPFLYHLDFGAFAIVGSSPEILVRVRDGEVTIRPIAGTRPRGKTPAEDRELAAELLADEKERAEHLMLLDLGRNDVGRVAEIGSVKVTDSFFLEYYSHVMHIVSNVTAKLDQAKHDAIDALMAGFPAGTVSGAPKVRAMQIIDELERREARPLCRLRRLFLGRRRDGHLHRAAHGRRQGRRHARPGGRRHRRRLRPRHGAGRVPEQGGGPLPRRRGGDPVCGEAAGLREQPPSARA